jgi:hypothetical protein
MRPNGRASQRARIAGSASRSGSVIGLRMGPGPTAFTLTRCSAHSKARFEVEIVYLFLKILLDRTAETFVKYFGGIGLTKWGSTYRDLTQKIEKNAKKMGLVVDPELVELMKGFVPRVVEYRNDAIEHLPTLHAGILATWTGAADGKRDFQMVGAGGQVSETPTTLIRDADRYMVMLVDCFEANRLKSRCREQSIEHQ